MKKDNIKDNLLYRKVNRRVYREGGGVKKGSKYSYSRHSKESNKRFDEGVGYKEPIKNAKSNYITSGYDYTPLFMFLLKNVGQDFDEILKEVTPRLNTIEPVYWMVDKSITREQVTDYLNNLEKNKNIIKKGYYNSGRDEYNKAQHALFFGTFRCGECSTYSQMWIDENNKLQLVDPSLSNRKLWYDYQFTETHNGNVLGKN